MNKPSPEPWPPVQKGENLPGAGLFGFKLFLISLAIPFVVVAFGAVRMIVAAQIPIPDNIQAIPPLVWGATGAILLTSLFAHWMVTTIREDKLAATRRYAIAALGAAAFFTISQIFSWSLVHEEFLKVARDPEVYDQVRVYRVVFYMLTGFHALHVLGGFVYHLVVLHGINRRKFWSLYHPGIEFVAWYWHFVDLAWLFVLATLLVVL